MPAKDSTVTDPLDAVSLYFTEQPVSYGYFTVTAPSGVRVDRPWSPGETKRLDEPVRELFLVNGVWEPKLYHEGFEARVPVGYWPEKGVYVAHYWHVASDGDKVRGELRFTYTGPTTKPPKGWKTPTNAPDPALLAASGETTSGSSPEGAQAGPSAGASPACTPRTMPETGCDQGSGDQSGAATPVAAPGDATGSPASSGVDLWVWLLPALLIVGVGVMVARAARPRTAGGRPASKKPAGPRGKPAAARGRPTPSKRAGKPARPPRR
ncbi:hypothetical protein Sme01_34110 [Sphaerisporangium melleum]|uniref:CopC domain-containing protein n=1 Tax=Sphaerisporangium melleum TaxID=321316 RepID=A0A917QX03_9ACTN|nr:hypothetical protein GCM10007964_16790 [Sphaerisporangium melleum]GII70935.1 hypothetical protein Sme01_34110 [Sphaerisporangium melleum]